MAIFRRVAYDVRLVAHSPPQRRRLAILRARVEARVRLPLIEGNAEEAALVAYALSDEATARAAALSPSPEPACVSGCSYCCHVHVEATAPEVLAIARFVVRNLSLAERAAIQERLSTGVDALSDEERWAARVPCALLDPQGRCSVHPVRPLRCRAFHSCSADACRSAFLGTSDDLPVTNAILAREFGAIEAGYDQALKSAGRPPAGLRLERALTQALLNDCIEDAASE